MIRRLKMTFDKAFSDCMGTFSMPVPSGLFDSALEAAETIASLEAAGVTYGLGMTIGEIIAVGGLSGALEIAGAVTVSAYVGVCIGCAATAAIDSATS
jgi:hypothetical protein